MKTTLDVALIGYGLGGANFHAPFIASTGGLRLATIMTGDAARRADASRRHPGATIVGSLDALLATRPDVVAISSPNATHAPLATAALEAGAHVVVDKPFAATAAEARAIGRVAERVGRLAIPFQNRRWDGDFLTVRRLIDEGTLGDVVRFESRFDRWRPVPKPGWCRPDAIAAAEDVVHDLGTHLIDQAVELFGPVQRVQATLRRVHPSVVSWDDMLVVLVHESGVHSHLGATMAAGIAGPRFHVLGTRGAYVKSGVDPQEGALREGTLPGAAAFGEEGEPAWGRVGAGGETRVVPTVRGDYAAFYAAVARAILHGAPPPVTVEQAAAVLDVVDDVLRAASSPTRTS